MNQQYLIYIWLASIVVALSGCVSAYHHTDAWNAESPLEQGKSVIISIPEDGRYGGDVYRNSGEMTSEAVKLAFSRYSSNVEITDEYKTIDSIRSKLPGHYAYFVEPSILHWEERATEWSGKPDRIEIQIQVYDVVSGLEIFRRIYSGKSKWATFGGGHPQDLLPEPTQKFVDSLYNQ
ncbi:DUF4823 domain-containing protein [Verrucomicrobia bacterium]|nr:DUF4823 domain-containing protein [Verrucomicrobiota bacterium]